MIKLTKNILSEEEMKEQIERTFRIKLKNFDYNAGKVRFEVPADTDFNKISKIRSWIQNTWTILALYIVREA